jgi:peptidoglycan-associated lipoprotein
MKKLILSVLLLNLLAACSSPAPKEAVVEPQASAATATADAAASAQAEADAKAAADAAAVAAAAAAQAQADADAAAAQAKADAEAALASRSVFFPFDVDAIQDADKDKIVTHAQNLAQNPNLKVRVEGNADERGSSEYNLALGQRRAKNTKKALVLGGAKAAQITTVSYGEEKPRAAGHDESAWSQNRRADINYDAAK